MKKKLIFAMSAIVALFATSCQENDFIANSGATSTVAFTVSTPEIASRAYSDGTTATELQYAVYDETGAILPDLTETEGEIHGSTTVELKLTTGNKYYVIFWAAEPNAPYTVDLATKTMAVDYDGVLSNNENLDAFYAWKEFIVTGAQTETIELKRPFAQLNIGTSDYAASTSAGYTPEFSSVTVKNIYNTLNLWNGEVNNEVEVTFDYAAIKKDERFPVAGYEYLAMNYLLVASQKALVDIEFGYTETDEAAAKTRTVGSVPVQRNYRTNIYGQLLTSDVDINVEIKPAYDEPAHELVSGNYSFVADRDELQAALDKEPTGIDHIIYLTEDIEGNVTRTENGGNIVIDGQGHKFDGGIHIWGGSAKGNETTVIRSINFETATKDLVFVHSTETTGNSRYANNVTDENCTFTATGAAVNTAVGVKFQQAYNIAIKNCEATGVHSLAQFQSYDNALLIENVKVNGKNGIAFGNSADVTVNGAEIVANGYGIRADGNASRGNLFVENADITAAEPIVVRKATTEKYNVKLGENVALHTNGVYEVIFTTGDDDETPVAPAAANYSIEGAENFYVFPLAVSATEVNVYNAAQLNHFINEGKDVVLTEDIAVAKADAVSNGYGVVGIYQLNGGVIDGNGNDISVNAWATWDSAINTTGGTIKNVNVTGGMRGIFISHNSNYSDKVILENVTIDGTVYTISCDQGTNKGLEAYNSTFNGWTSYAATIGAVKFDGCSFGEGQGYAFCRPYAATEFVNCDFAAGYEIDARAAVTFENCTINGVALTAANLATLVVSNIANATVK